MKKSLLSEQAQLSEEKSLGQNVNVVNGDDMVLSISYQNRI